MKFFHNKFAQKLVAILFGLIIIGYFAWNFYYFGYWLGQKFLPGVFEGPTILGYTCAGIMCLGVLFVFFFKDYMKEDVEAYEDEKGDGSYIKALKELTIGIYALEVFSVLFRWYALNWSIVGFIMLGVGLALLWIEHKLGKVLHAQANVPHDVYAERVANEAGRRLWEKGSKSLGNMSIDQLRRLAGFDPTPLDEVHDVTHRTIIEAEERKYANTAKRKGVRARAKAMANAFMHPGEEIDKQQSTPLPSGREYSNGNFH